MTKKTDFIETYTGKAFYPLEPDLESIDILDIAHGLSYQGRFTGQSKTFLSIAQHCINVTNEVAYLTKDWSKEKSLKAQKIALIHDASEAYISDINSPSKKHMPEYKKIEERLQNMIYEKYGVSHNYNDEEYQIVDYVDKNMAPYEAMFLMSCHNWKIDSSYLVQIQKQNNINKKLKNIDLKEKHFSETEKEYLELFYKLFNI